jgi:cation diffusion facilitator CzcD-associated flavoprotein CzcO
VRSSVKESIGVVVVGGGQVGLAVSHGLTDLGVEHVVVERGRVGQTWRDRWDSFSLSQTPSTGRERGAHRG